MELGVTAITVFAFSIENFKRTTEEVDALMQIAYDKLGDLLQRPYVIPAVSIQVLEQKPSYLVVSDRVLFVSLARGVHTCSEAKQYFRIRGIGDLSLLPQQLQVRIREIEELSRHNEAGELNICFSYSATNEITSAVRQAVSEQLENLNEAANVDSQSGIEAEITDEISQGDLEKCLLTYGSPEIDMIVRTSGEIRLSDFMLWQSSASCLMITDVLWPEFSASHLYGAVLYYQEHYESLKVCTFRLMIDSK